MPLTITLSEAPLSKDEIDKAARELAVEFPSDYVQFMLNQNGGRPHPRAFSIFWQPSQACGEDWQSTAMSIIYHIWNERDCSLIRSNLVSFEGRIPKDTFAIGADAFGNQILQSVAGPLKGKILFWAMEHEVEEGNEPGYDNVGLVADSFDDFINHRLY